MPEINKVVYGNTTLIDLTDTTAEASDVAQGKYFYGRDGVRTAGTATGGGGGAITVTTTQDSHGGDVVTITAVDISSDTVAADKLLYGYTAHDYTGQAITGSYTPASPNLQAKTNISPTTSSQTIEADTGYDGLSSVQINAMPSGSATTPATTVTANPSISVNSSTGVITATASATKSVTPTVSAGYVSSGTAGTITVSGSNTSNLTTQAAQTIHPSTSDQTITSGKYLTGTQTFKAVTHNLTAGIIKSGEVVKIGDSTDDDCVTSITGTYSGGGSGKNAQIATGIYRVANSGYVDTGISLTVSKSGTYDVYWCGQRSSTTGTSGSILTKNGNTVGSPKTTFDSTYPTFQTVHLSNISLSEDDVLGIEARSRGSSYYMYVMNLVIIEA